MMMRPLLLQFPLLILLQIERNNLIYNLLYLISCFSQLFGEIDADEEVSPDTEDPEAVGKLILENLS